MKNKTYKFYFVKYLALLLVFCTSCQSSTQFEEADLYGEWKVANWEILSSGEKRSNKMDMSFQANGSYEVDYGSEKEIGKFWIDNEYLFTVEKDQAEKKVKLLTLSKDTMFFQMNRAGELENVLFTKQ